MDDTKVINRFCETVEKIDCHTLMNHDFFVKLINNDEFLLAEFKKLRRCKQDISSKQNNIDYYAELLQKACKKAFSNFFKKVIEDDLKVEKDTVKRIVNQEIYGEQWMIVNHLLSQEDGGTGISPENLINYFSKEEAPEIIQWWSVSDWLAEKLKNIGEVVLEADYDRYWGREGVGALIDDGALKKISQQLCQNKEVF